MLVNIILKDNEIYEYELILLGNILLDNTLKSNH